MKILLAGAWEYAIYEEACADALREEGVEVVRHAWSGCFRGLAGRVEHKWTVAGPGTRALNRELLLAVSREKPDVLFIWRGTHLFPETLKRARDEAGVLVGYNNDDCFSPRYHQSARLFERRMWRYFIRTLPVYDLQWAFRPVNLEEYRDAGCARAAMLPPYYRETIDRPLNLSPAERERFGCDVAFIGHYEADDREAMLAELLGRGIRVKVYGDATWRKSGAERRLRPLLGEAIAPAYGEDYVRAVNGADIALCFLSKRHRDPYTRRCFEIPACGTMMLSERTPELEELFVEGREAAYFGSSAELLEKTVFYLNRKEAIESIAKAGRERVVRDGHGVRARMRGVKEQLEGLLAERKGARG